MSILLNLEDIFNYMINYLDDHELFNLSMINNKHNKLIKENYIECEEYKCFTSRNILYIKNKYYNFHKIYLKQHKFYDKYISFNCNIENFKYIICYSKRRDIYIFRYYRLEIVFKSDIENYNRFIKLVKELDNLDNNFIYISELKK